MDLKTRLLERLQGRIDNALRTIVLHPDHHVKEETRAVRAAYQVALSDVESIFKEFEVEDLKSQAYLSALIARGLFPTEEERKTVAAALQMPVEYLFPEPPT